MQKIQITPSGQFNFVGHQMGVRLEKSIRDEGRSNM